MGLVLVMVFSKLFSFSLLLLISLSPHPVEIKVIKDLPWPPPVGQLDSGESPADSEAGASVPPQHGQPSYEDANGGSWVTVGYPGGLSGACHDQDAAAL